MKAKVLLTQNADLFWSLIADSVGWIPVLEHCPDRIIEGQECFLVDYLALANEQQNTILDELIRRGEPACEAQERAMTGVPLSVSQVRTIDVDGTHFSVDDDYGLDALASYGEYDLFAPWFDDPVSDETYSAWQAFVADADAEVAPCY